MDTLPSLRQDDFFDRVDRGVGAKMRFRAVGLAAVMKVPPILDDWLPANHPARIIAELVDDEPDLSATPTPRPTAAAI
jgi:hypothetical protein